MARRDNASKETFYSRFDTKEGLLTAVMTHRVQGLETNLVTMEALRFLNSAKMVYENGAAKIARFFANYLSRQTAGHIEGFRTLRSRQSSS